MSTDITTSYNKNKKAFAFYEILDKIEAGIQLTGGEVKSVKAGHVNLKGSYIDIGDHAAWLRNANVSKFPYDNNPLEPTRVRKLLLHKVQLLKLEQQQEEKGITLIPLEIYGKKNLIKVLIGICRGKKMHDRRDDLKKKAQDLDVKRALKKYE
ncbi:MAG: SsrA-binding protein SmpB [Candidatus Peregrinibacteria bacterium]|nr:SsrA-binding protein SmpB [Candidatus Peregrinibacteria bacterium]